MVKAMVMMAKAAMRVRCDGGMLMVGWWSVDGMAHGEVMFMMMMTMVMAMAMVRRIGMILITMRKAMVKMAMMMMTKHSGWC